MVDAIGIDHVGIGSDTDLLSSRVGSGTNRAWPGPTGGFFPATVARCCAKASRRTRSPKPAGKTTAGFSGRSRLGTPKRYSSHIAGSPSWIMGRRPKSAFDFVRFARFVPAGTGDPL